MAYCRSSDRSAGRDGRAPATLNGMPGVAGDLTRTFSRPLFSTAYYTLSRACVNPNSRVRFILRGPRPEMRLDLLIMTLQEFRESLLLEAPAAELTLALAGLWWDAKGDWKQAHESAQQDVSPGGSWVHAYLHRKEGDLSNAAYWYSRAGRSPAQMPLDQEWAEIAGRLLTGSPV